MLELVMFGIHVAGTQPVKSYGGCKKLSSITFYSVLTLYALYFHHIDLRYVYSLIVQPLYMHALHLVRSMSVMVQVRDFQAVIGKEVRQQCLECTAIVQSSCMHTLRVLRSMSVTVQVRDFQAVIGKEVRQQCLEKMGGKPDILLACVGGGSNAIGLFHEFVDDADVRLIGRPPDVHVNFVFFAVIISHCFSFFVSCSERF